MFLRSQDVYVQKQSPDGAVDLNVDYEKEIEPNMGRCLVRDLHRCRAATII